MSTNEEGSFRGARTRRIVWQGWAPEGHQPEGVVTIAHGYGEHVGRYKHVAQRLCDAGFAVYGPDHHGHGLSGGKRGRITLREAVADLDQLVVRVARERHPKARHFLLGHSMGGLLALQYAAAHQQRLSGLALTGPLAQVDGSPALLLLARFLGLVAPGASVSKVDPHLVSRDPVVVADYIADPLNYHGEISAAVARQFVIATGRLPESVAGIKLPTLLQWGAADRICPPAGSEMVAEQIGTEDLTVRTWPGAFHEILNEPERDDVIDVIVEWLSAHLK